MTDKENKNSYLRELMDLSLCRYLLVGGSILTTSGIIVYHYAKPEYQKLGYFLLVTGEFGLATFLAGACAIYIQRRMSGPITHLKRDRLKTDTSTKE